MHSVFVNSHFKLLKDKEEHRNRSGEMKLWMEKEASQRSPDEQDAYIKGTLDEKGVRLEDVDKGKVTLLVNLTLNEKAKARQEKQLEKLKGLAENYGADNFTVLG